MLGTHGLRKCIKLQHSHCLTYVDLINKYKVFWLNDLNSIFRQFAYFPTSCVYLWKTRVSNNTAIVRCLYIIREQGTIGRILLIVKNILNALSSCKMWKPPWSIKYSRKHEVNVSVTQNVCHVFWQNLCVQNVRLWILMHFLCNHANEFNL